VLTTRTDSSLANSPLPVLSCSPRSCSKDHKAKTHSSILQNAAVQLRAKGIHGIGVAGLMKEAGLTHGGFYAHFKSKDALVAEACARAFEETMDLLRVAAKSPPGRTRRAAFVNAYLTPRHRDNAGHGCVIAALGTEIAREGPEARRAFTDKMEQIIETVVATTRRRSPEAVRREAIATMAMLVGTMVLARAVDRRGLSDEILEAGRAALVMS